MIAPLGHIATPNGPVGGFNPPPASHPPPPPTLPPSHPPALPPTCPPPPTHPPTPLKMQSVILQWLRKKLTQNPEVLPRNITLTLFGLMYNIEWLPI